MAPKLDWTNLRECKVKLTANLNAADDSDNLRYF